MILNSRAISILGGMLLAINNKREINSLKEEIIKNK